MARRKLTRHQTWRIEKSQEQRQLDAHNAAPSEENARIGQSGVVIANYGAALDVKDHTGNTIRCHLRQNLETLVVGDRVVWQPIDNIHGVITALQPRSSLLAHPDPYGKNRLLAANIEQIFIVIAPLPPCNTNLIDQYLVAAETTGIDPLILLNKVDLLNDENRTHIEEGLQRYRAIGYTVLYTSCKSGQGFDALHTVLHRRTSAFAGQSGVGKSSLVKELLPSHDIPIGELSAQNSLGQHTTSVSRLYPLPQEGNIIDSPGVRAFRLQAVSEHELEHGFREFVPYLGHCKFRNCRHLDEPGCALIEAMKQGRIHKERLGSFYKLRAALKD